MGERLEHLKRSHLALEADDLIPEYTMQHVYGKEPERQVRACTLGHRKIAPWRGGCSFFCALGNPAFGYIP